MSANPKITPSAGKVFRSRKQSGMSSEHTTAIMHPAAKESVHGRIARAKYAAAAPNIAAGISAAPDACEKKNALKFPHPCVFSGYATQIPSGKFCMPIPTASASAENTAERVPSAAPNATPNAIPSGILCAVTAAYKSAPFRLLSSFPPNNFAKKRSLPRIKAPPRIKPTVAASHGAVPSLRIAGNNNEKKLAEIMIPAAAPVTAGKKRPELFPEKNTVAAPNAVMPQVNREHKNACHTPFKSINHSTANISSCVKS